MTCPFIKYKDSLTQISAMLWGKESSICIAVTWEQEEANGPFYGGYVLLWSTSNRPASAHWEQAARFQGIPFGVSMSEPTEPNSHTHENWTKTAQKKEHVNSGQVTEIRLNSKSTNFLRDFFQVRGLIRIFCYYGRFDLEFYFKESK